MCLKDRLKVCFTYFEANVYDRNTYIHAGEKRLKASLE